MTAPNVSPSVSQDRLDARVAAVALHRAGDLAGAEAAYQALLDRWPDDAPTLNNYGALMRRAGRLEASLDMMRAALRADERAPDSWSNFGNTLAELERYDEAMQALIQCLKLAPGHRDALSNLGVVLDRVGRHAEAISIFDIAVEAEPENPKFHTNRALARLALGYYREGFAEYEWRWRTPDMIRHQMGGPVWDGGAYAGKTLMVYTEGGFGDVIQFARFLPQAAALGGRLVLCVPPALVTLMAGVPGVARVADRPDALGPVDLVCPIMSLAHRLEIGLEQIAPGTPYLAAPDSVARWRRRLGEKPAGPRIGLVWSGGAHLDHDEAAMMNLKRSLTLAQLAPVLEAAPGASFHALQVGPAAAQLQTFALSARVSDHASHLTSFEETAGLIGCLDLVVTVDTSVAHLAGALGCPVWMMSRFDQCWRWLAGRVDSPWYAGMRIYRQPMPGDWGAVIAAVARDIGKACDGPAIFSERTFGGLTPD